jgi:GT2 family glycosyltransferase
MNKLPKVYIIILNFNSYKDTMECIRSLEAISYSNYEIVIVDNNSKDDSVKEISENCPKYKLLLSKENLGYANGNNIGIKYALEQDADYVCILNNDVIVEQNFLDPIIEIFNIDNTIGMVGPCICEYSDRNTVQAMGANINLFRGLAMGQHEGKDYNKIDKNFIDVDYLGGACFIVKSEVFRTIGLIPENYFLFYEETEFCLSARKSGYKLLCISISKVYHKRSSTISKYSGLSYYFLNRNRIIFMRRNANLLQKIIFTPYIILEGIGRVLLRKEPLKLFQYYIEGLRADADSIDMNKVNYYLNKS